MELSLDQQFALKAMLAWYDAEHKAKYITLGGYAGTGKTTLMAVLRQELAKRNPSLRVAFCSYTGRAARNLASRLEQHNCLMPRDSVSTIHGLIYSPIESGDGTISGWMRSGKPAAGLIILDEASMADSIIWEDLMSYGIPIAAVGDHGQLPPINGRFNLMASPDLTLKSIHRQASGSPIIKVSEMARSNGFVPPGNYGPGVKKYLNSDDNAREAIGELLENYHSDTLILCGYNSTRLRINAQIRQNLGFERPEPSSGDRVICLKNNSRKGIYNGMLGTIIDISAQSDGRYEAQIQMDDMKKPYSGFISASQFGSKSAASIVSDKKYRNNTDYFDFGYALTVHKAQGSQARRVILLEERFPRMDDEMWRRWLYTGITRAEEELYIFGRGEL
ncbi:MAG: ATP-dependent RecD-like DNA helicase [Elusimicrobiales bacterium]|nr:ATP-dependent RecD-like DNA helicase [Elusimicrobiales bacterium]